MSLRIPGPPVEKVQEEIYRGPFKLKFKIPKKIFSSAIYDSYLEETVPKVMPNTAMHPLDGIGEFDGFFMGVKNRYRYMFKNKGTCWKNFYVG